MISDRREATRFNLNLPVKICDQDGKSVIDVVKAVNISAGGLRLETTNFFKPDQALSMKFLINSETTASIPTQVVWSEDEHGECHCGVKFLRFP
jgi:hypothetical protein